MIPLMPGQLDGSMAVAGLRPLQEWASRVLAWRTSPLCIPADQELTEVFVSTPSRKIETASLARLRKASAVGGASTCDMTRNSH